MVLPVDLLARLQADDELRHLGAAAEVSFGLKVAGGQQITIGFSNGDIDEATEASFIIELDEADWSAVLASTPNPRQQHILAFVAPRGSGVVHGDRLAFAQHLHLVRRVVEVAANRYAVQQPISGSLERVSGRYVRVAVNNWGECDVYTETAGTGRPVLLLHTAGADGRQFHGLLSDVRLTDENQLIAFDMPWHGRSNPAGGARSFDYSLTTQTYTDCVVNLIEALELPCAPVIVGASMAGAAVLEVAALHPETISGVVSCQAGPRVANRHTPWLRNPCVNQALHLPEWTYGLMSPMSPVEHRDRVWWGYSQGGWGSYERDIAYYSQCWDIDNICDRFGADTPPVILMNGTYDYSVPPEATQALIAAIPGARYREMPQLGHFPHAENPEVFAEHLLWALSEIDSMSAAH